MRKRQRLIFRTRTNERILIRQKGRCPGLWKSSKSSVGEPLPDAEYRLEIHRIEAGETTVIFGCDLVGPVEIVETGPGIDGIQIPIEDENRFEQSKTNQK